MLYKSVLSSCKLVEVDVVVGCVCKVEVDEVDMVVVVLPGWQVVEWTILNQSDKFASPRFVDVAPLWREDKLQV